MSNHPHNRPQPAPAPVAPLIVIPAQGITARPIAGAPAVELVLYAGPNGAPLAQAGIVLGAEQLAQLVEQLGGILAQLPAGDAGPQLVTPPSGLVVPRG